MAVDIGRRSELVVWTLDVKCAHTYGEVAHHRPKAKLYRLLPAALLGIAAAQHGMDERVPCPVTRAPCPVTRAP